MNRAPTTYAEWSELFNQMKDKGDEPIQLQLANQGTIAWQSVVADRFLKKIIELINYRLNMAVDIFQKKANRFGHSERELIMALTDVKKELKFLKQLAIIKPLPQHISEELVKLVTNQAENIQASLLDSSKLDKTGKLTSIIKNNSLNIL